MKETIGFIGLGIMGKPMARNLLRAGYPLVVHNRSRAAVGELAGEGARAASSPREAASQADVVITMLPDSPDVEAVVLGPNGALEGMRPGTTLIDMSTISPRVTRAIAAACAEKGVMTLDAPVSGSDRGAREGTLSIMVGGDDATFEKCKPILQALGKTIVHVGGVGMGETVKLVNQVVGMSTLQAVCEGLILAARAGADVGQVIQVVGGGAARSWMIENLAPLIASRDFRPGFMVRLAQKDLRLALALADELHVSLPNTSITHQLFRSVEAGGEPDAGVQALIKAVERLAQHEVRGERG